MSEELSYVIVTPYSIRKSRTGGIISRLISRTGLDLVGARMFAPSKELTEKYASMLVTSTEPRHRAVQELIRDYVLTNFQPSSYRPRVMVLLFRGENAISKILSAVGHIIYEHTSGETIRDTFGDYLTDESGKVTYFEPGVLVPTDAKSNKEHLKLWAEYSDIDGGLLTDVVAFPSEANVQKSLVLIKPDNFRYPSSRPGGVIDVFSRTGLSIIGMKVHRMSVAQAQEFYGPVLDAITERKKQSGGKEVRELLEKELSLPLDEATEKALGELLAPISARVQWETIIQFMAGSKPSETPASQLDQPGSEKCIAIVYQGADAVRKIREVLGPTDPSKAPAGTIRREFGQTMMINAAHASDSPENAQREMGIIKINDNEFKELATFSINNL